MIPLALSTWRARTSWEIARGVLGERAAWYWANARSDHYLGRYAIGSGYARQTMLSEREYEAALRARLGEAL